MSQCLQALGCPSCPPDQSLASLRDRAEAELKRLAEIEVTRGKLIESINTLNRQLEVARAQKLAVQQRLAKWHEQWTLAVAPLSLAADVTTDEAAELVNQATDLQTKIKEARDGQRRITVLRQEATQFATDVRSLCQRVAPELNPDASPASPSVEIAAGELLKRFRTAHDIQAAKQALIKQRESELANSRNAEQSFQEAGLQLAALCLEAQCARWTICPGPSNGHETRSSCAIDSRSSTSSSRNSARASRSIGFARRLWHRSGSIARATSSAGI